MEDHDLNNGGFRILLMKKLNDIQGNKERKFNVLRNKINERKRYFTKKIETIKNNQIEILKKFSFFFSEECTRDYWK